MKNIITTLVLFLAATLCASAQFTFDDPNATELIIESYYNEENGVDVIIPEEINGKKVVAVHGLLGKGDASQSVNNIYIPENVSITGNLVEQANKPFRSTVFYGGKIESIGYTPFKCSTISGDEIDNILVLMPKGEKAEDLMVSTTNIFNAGDATITLSNNDKIIIRIFLYGPKDRNNKYKQIREIGSERFKNLIWALNQHCEHNSELTFSNISIIDLSKLDGKYKPVAASSTSYDVQFAFEDYNPLDELPLGATLLTKDANYTSIKDKADFIPADYNGTINYQRSNTQGWNSVCLPFDIQESDFPEGTKIYTFSGVSNEGGDDCINLSRLNKETLEAGTPCYIWCDDQTTEWNLQLTGRTISASVEAKTVEHNGWQLIGALQTQTIGAGRYKLNADGTELGPTDSADATVTALRCYFSPTQTKTNARIAVSVDDTAAITQVSNDSCAESVRVYDLLGRPSRSHGIELRRGNIRLTF